MYRAILVPLDGSALSEYALPAAIPLARRSGAQVHLVHVRTMDPSLTDGGDADAETAYLHTTVERLKGSGVTARYAVLEEKTALTPPGVVPGRRIAELLHAYARAHAIDVIVTTSHGRGGVRRGWLGSVADCLVRDSCVPVMVLRPPRKAARPRVRAELSFRRLLLPLDGSLTAESAIEPAIELATLTGASVTMIRTVEPLRAPANPYVHWVMPPRARLIEQKRHEAAEYLNHVADRIRSRVPEIHFDVAVASPVRAILAAAARNDVDAIVMATHGAGGATRMLLGSVADKVIRTGSVPVMVVRPATRDLECASPTPESTNIEAHDVMAELGAFG